MRTTVTLEDDVASELEKLRAKRRVSFKEILNEVLRRGLRSEPARGRAAAPRFETTAVDLGPCLIGTIDEVGEALALGEGEAFR